MNLPTTEFSATLPYTSATDTSTNGTASAGTAGSGGRSSAPPSSPLPGDAAEFAQAVHGASPQQDSVPGQPAPMHDPEPAPQGRQSAQPAQPGQSGQSPQRGADAASSSATGNTGRSASHEQQPAQDPAPTPRTAPQGGREQTGDMPSAGPTDQRISGATNRPGEKAEAGTPSPMRTSGEKSDMGEANTSGQRRTSGQTDTPRPVRTSGTPGDAGEKASTGKTNKPDSRGDAILNALGGAASAEGALAAPAFMAGTPYLAEPAHLEGTAGTGGAGGAGGAASLAEISGMDQRVLTQLVDSILVSAQEGKQEVRIKVQDAVLKDTTIVVRLQDGQLDVQLRTGDSYSSQLLHQNVGTLRHALEGRSFGQPLSSLAQVQVRVEDREASQDDTGQQGQQGQRGQQDQRSRGNFLWDRDE